MKQQQEHKDNDSRGTDQAGRWSDCGQGSQAAGGGGTAWPEMQTHLLENKSNLSLIKIPASHFHVV